MFLMYVDESGDTGMLGSPTRYFTLTGLVLHELRWQVYLDLLINFRQSLKARFGLKLREEIHSAHMINRPGELSRIPRHDRLTIVRLFANLLATMTDFNAINVIVDKSTKGPKYNVFENAWTALIQRFENTLSHHNFRGPTNPDDRGVLFPDNTDNKKLTGLLRRMRRFNPVPNQVQYGGGYRNILVSNIVEDPNFRVSDQSYFIQAADLIAFLVYQSVAPSAYMREKQGDKYLKRLEPIVCKVASPRDALGIVRL